MDFGELAGRRRERLGRSLRRTTFQLRWNSEHGERERNQIAGLRRQLQGSNVSVADLGKWPRIKQPLRPITRFITGLDSGGTHLLCDPAKLNVMKDDPSL